MHAKIRAMRSSLAIVALALALPACAESCGCGEQAARAPAQPVPARAAGGAAGAASEPQLPVDSEAAAAQTAAMRVQLSEMPETGEREALEKAASGIDGVRDLGEPIAGTKLTGALPSKIEGYAAEGPAQAGTTAAEAGTATVVSRRYRAGASTMNVKVTDTADAPGLRREIAEQLTLVGNAPSGHQRGQLAGSVPGVVAYHDEARASRAMALMAGRFLVEVMVDDTAKKDIAWSAVQALDGKALSDATPRSAKR